MANPLKVTISFDDGSTVDFFPQTPAPTQTVELHAGETLNVKAD